MSERAETSSLFIFVSNNHDYRKRKILQDLKSSRVGSKCISSCCESMTHQTTSTAHSVNVGGEKTGFETFVWVFCVLPHLLIYQVRTFCI